MLNIEIVYLGSLNKNWQNIKEHYRKMLRPYVQIEFKELKAQSFSSNNRKQAILKESEKIENYLKKRNPSSIYLLSELGETFDSSSLADFLNSHDSAKIILVIGGALGFSDKLKQKYDLISLSALTFPHQMTQVILLEQIYRSIMILKNKNYHY